MTQRGRERDTQQGTQPDIKPGGFVRVARLQDFGEHSMKTVQVGRRSILLVKQGEEVYATDPRCPHMGFPLSRGSVKDGILTCHWHHARFELCSGGAFDLFADDVHVYATQRRGDEVWLDPRPQRDEVAYQRGRLKGGLEQTIPLVLAKAVLSLSEHQVEAGDILRLGGVFGARQRGAGWRDGLTIMTAMGNLLPHLQKDDRPLALYHGLLHVARNVAGQPPHHSLEPLPSSSVNPARLGAWLRQFAEVRDRDGVERVLLTALKLGQGPADVADMLVAAVTDHYYLDGGHSIDFINKAFELLDGTGWGEAATILPSIVPAITAATRMEETNSWRHPLDLKAVLEPIFAELLEGELIKDVHREGVLSQEAFDGLVGSLLGDDPAHSAHALARALRGGAGLTQLSQALLYAAALRVARFHTANEFSDWLSVLHTLTSANATHQLLKRAPSLAGARAIWHAAMHLYLNRFLNTPQAKLPDERTVAALPEDAGSLLGALLELTDGRQKVEEAAAVTYRYLSLGHADERLIHTLAHTLLREDGEFHSYQLLEAGIALYRE
ncbi:MAG: Rieske 2Fe-2S domain-containing protein, partial [Deinococcota bacterium]|nr:Rieske 2Fe-2S domain-containing protein [Deinococcota bacterium]